MVWFMKGKVLVKFLIFCQSAGFFDRSVIVKLLIFQPKKLIFFKTKICFEKVIMGHFEK